MDHDAHVPPPMYFTPPGGRTDTRGCPTGLARPPSSVVIVLLVRPGAARPRRLHEPALSRYGDRRKWGTRVIQL